MPIAENIERLRERISKTCIRCGRNPDEVQIVAVTKYVEADRIVEAVEAGIEIVGENRVQEAWTKYQSLRIDTSWHMIGHLQTNKVKRALQFASVIQSVDSLHLAEEIQNQADRLDRRVGVFVQVNTSGEPSKFGFAPPEVAEAIEELAKHSRLNIEGLMTIGLFSDDAELVRPCFRKLREIRDEVMESSIENVDLVHLSMGMTDDFELAIEEGATMVRIGKEIFGARKPVSG